MDKRIVDQYRALLLDGLNQLTEDNRTKFKWMYGRKGGKRLLEESTAMSIEDVVNEVPEDKFELALDQIKRTIQKNAKE